MQLQSKMMVGKKVQNEGPNTKHKSQVSKDMPTKFTCQENNLKDLKTKFLFDLIKQDKSN